MVNIAGSSPATTTTRPVAELAYAARSDRAYVGSNPTGPTIHRCKWCDAPIGKSSNGRQKQFCDASHFGHWNNAQRSEEQRRSVATLGGNARGLLWRNEAWLSRYY